ncbi:MAG: acetyl-CoA carboxylase biotin carboxyl carrier protein, partial [Alphaproteobacteria bacterium]|nr:acetyl-CoA carboxylase biotin carboxyl carrier protein [Alphaproteobacteria bacterium]
MAKTEVDKNLIRELAALMDETGLCEIEIGSQDERMRLVRLTSPIAAAVPLSAPIQPTAPASASSASV